MNKTIYLYSINKGGDQKEDIYYDPADPYSYVDFIVQNATVKNATYHPAKIIYTGATVGGIHTGGFTKIDARYSVSKKLTGAASVEYKHYGVDIPLSMVDISMPAPLLAIAKSEFGLDDLVDDEKQILRLSKPLTSHDIEVIKANLSMDVGSMVNLANNNTERLYSQGTCQKVVDFLTSVENGDYLTEYQIKSLANSYKDSEDPGDWNVAKQLLERLSDTTYANEIAEINKKIAGQQIFKCGKYVLYSQERYDAFKKAYNRRTFGIGLLLFSIVLLIANIALPLDLASDTLGAVLLFLLLTVPVVGVVLIFISGFREQKRINKIK